MQNFFTTKMIQNYKNRLRLAKVMIKYVTFLWKSAVLQIFCYRYCRLDAASSSSSEAINYLCVCCAL